MSKRKQLSRCKKLLRAMAQGNNSPYMAFHYRRQAYRYGRAVAMAVNALNECGGHSNLVTMLTVAIEQGNVEERFFNDLRTPTDQVH